MKNPKRDARALEKLKDPALRDRVLEGGDEPVSVILEVDLPPQQVAVWSRDDRLRSGSSLGRKVIDEPVKRQRTNADRIARTGKYIEKVIGTPPRWLAAARAFTFHATPEQLRDLAAFELTRAVRPNRRLPP
jgi:hypothetical protein